jgi:hypothetical protein
LPAALWVNPEVKRLIFAKTDEDLTKHPIAGVERHLVG